MKHFKIKIALVLVTVTALAFVLNEFVNAYFQIKNKEEWSILQAIDSRYRSSTDESTTLFASLNGYEAIGIRVASEPATSAPSRYPRVWVLAAPKYREMVKVLSPEEKYEIAPSDLKLILRNVPGVSAATLVELIRHLKV